MTARNANKTEAEYPRPVEAQVFIDEENYFLWAEYMMFRRLLANGQTLIQDKITYQVLRQILRDRIAIYTVRRLG